MKWEERFSKTEKECGGMPFWAWNCHVERETALRQIGYFEEMGMGGFVIHSRTGLDLPYLGAEFMELVQACVKAAVDRGMKVWLYDEDRWPSGFAGGLVTKNREYRARYLVFTPWSGGREPENSRHKKNGRLDLTPHGGGKLWGRYAVFVHHGRLIDYRMIEPGKRETLKSGEEIWYLYEEEMEENVWFNNQTYMDTLNPDAVNCFLEVTYEAYKRALGDVFGREVTAIFTDEPQFVHKRFPEYEDSREPVILPYTSGMELEFERRFGFSFLERLPELLWDTGDDRSGEIRYFYHRFVGELFAETYCDKLGAWCRSHGIALTGHMKGEDTLETQAASLGEAMRHYRQFQIPGVDVLCDRRLYTTVKQAQSASRQMGRNQVASEEYGVTNWDFDFAGHKMQGDWQAALGVTGRVHHLAWMSMEGEAKRDFPASIFYQSPWYREYATLERYFSRIRMAMETGRPVVHIGVIHPIESFWMVYGGADHKREREWQETQFQELAEWLLFGLLDFDYISEGLLADMPEGENGLHFGEMCYQVILIPELLTLRKSTLERLWKFQQDGGKVVFLGRIPEFVEARRSDGVKHLAEHSLFLKMKQHRILEVLEPQREVEILDNEGRRSGGFLYQLRTYGDERWLFVANGRKPPNRDEPKSQVWDIMVKGVFRIELWDAMNGTVIPVEAEKIWRENQVWTVIRTFMTDQDSLLLRLEADREYRGAFQTIHKYSIITTEENLEFIQSLTADACNREEPNVLMLDQACYCLDDNEWQGTEEVLRIENKIRKILGYPQKMEAYAQPWGTKGRQELTPPHTVTMRFEITSKIPVLSSFLAVERPREKEFFWNGTLIQAEDIGYYVDESIRRIRLPQFPAGTHHLTVKVPFHPDTSLEWMYLSGDFGVDVHNRTAVIVPPPPFPCYGSLAARGMPFYGGSIIYQSKIKVEEGEYVLEVTKFRAPLLAVSVDGKRAGIIAFAPYRLCLGLLSGMHEIEICAFGNRINTFGPVHNSEKENTWFGPGAWRTDGEKYCYAYQLQETGILEAPRLYRKQQKVV